MNVKQALKQCQQGELSSFDIIYDEYIHAIYRFIFYKTHHRETAEDLTSVTFMKALENIRKYKEDSAGFKTWLYRIARNTVIDHYRTNHPTGDIEDAWGIHSDDDIEKQTDLTLKLEAIRADLAKLSPEQREVVTLRVWGDHSFKEIAEITGKSEAACKMSFKRTVEKLGKQMALLTLFIYFQ